jgi:hypothetical protein
MGYEETVRMLFEMLEQANRADHTNDEDRKDWQRPHDSGQSNYYGHIYNAIKAIAGTAILDHHSDTWEVDMSLADRN